MQEMWVQSLGGEDPVEEEIVAHSSILAWRIPRAEEPGRLQSMGLQRVGHDLATGQQQITCPPRAPSVPGTMLSPGGVGDRAEKGHHLPALLRTN